MAIRLLGNLDPTYEVAEEIRRAISDCAGFAEQPIETAAARNESRAFYACGLVFALMAEKSVQDQGGRDVFDFIRPLILAHRDDRLISGDDWLAEFERLSGNQSASDDMRAMLKEGVADPSTHIIRMFAKAGLNSDGSSS